MQCKKQSDVHIYLSSGYSQQWAKTRCNVLVANKLSCCFASLFVQTRVYHLRYFCAG